MADPRNMDKQDKDWRRQSENIDEEEKEKRPHGNNYHDELTEDMKKRANLDEDKF